MRTITITEAREHRLGLSSAEASALQSVGRRMIGTRSWWGAPEGGTANPERAVLRVVSVGNGLWSVRAGNVVGLVVVGDLQLVIQPKIPARHLLYLLEVGGHVPRLDSSSAGGLASDTDLFELIASWFIGCVEQVLRADLLRDYQATQNFLPAQRGKIRPADTARAFYQGRVGLACNYERYDVNSPLNRLLKAATRAVLHAPALGRALQRRARRALARMSEVGEYTPHDDARVVVDRRAQHCTDAVSLARQILRGSGLTLQAGSSAAWTFLIETSDPVESGLRELLHRHMPDADVRKRRIRLGDSTLTLNPDVIFGPPSAVADIKYKISGQDWDRPDLYQLVAFATGYRVQEAALLSFGTSATHTRPVIDVGDVRTTSITWDASHEDPSEAATDFVRRVAQWLEPRATDSGRTLQTPVAGGTDQRVPF